MNSIKNGYVIYASVLPGGYRKSSIYIEKTKENAIKALKNEAKGYLYFLYGQQFLINVFSNNKLIFSKFVMPHIKYKLPYDVSVHFEYSNLDDTYSPANMYINGEYTELNDNDDIDDIDHDIYNQEINI